MSAKRSGVIVIEVGMDRGVGPVLAQDTLAIIINLNEPGNVMLRPYPGCCQSKAADAAT